MSKKWVEIAENLSRAGLEKLFLLENIEPVFYTHSFPIDRSGGGFCIRVVSLVKKSYLSHPSLRTTVQELNLATYISQRGEVMQKLGEEILKKIESNTGCLDLPCSVCSEAEGVIPTHANFVKIA